MTKTNFVRKEETVLYSKEIKEYKYNIDHKKYVFSERYNQDLSDFDDHHY